MPDYSSIAPTTRSSDPRMIRAVDGWLGMYEACFNMARSVQKSPVKKVCEEDEAYGIESAQRPRPEHLLQATLNSAKLFSDAGIRYALGGGLAINYHGHERATRDVDFFIELNKEKLGPVLAILADRDFCTHTLESPSYLPPDALFWWHPLQFGLPNAPPVDVDLLVAEQEFMKFLNDHAVCSNMNGIPLRVLGLEGLLILKLRAFRDRDRWDVKEILKKNPEPNHKLLDTWIARFNLESRLQQLQREAWAEGNRRKG